jgi:preprotein translocase subunit SecY
MKKFLDTLKNIFSIEELRNKIYWTLALILLYRIGTHIVLPGIDAASLANLRDNSSKGILGLLNIFAGGAFSNASIFALGVMPYISASIAVQLLTLAVPHFKKMQMDGESGRSQMNQITRYLTVAITMFQGSAYLVYLKSLGINPVSSISTSTFTIMTMFILTAGTLFVMWIGEKITDKGLGNGTSLIIMSGIISKLPSSLISEFTAKLAGDNGGLIIFIAEIIFLVVVIMAVILLVQGTRKIPVQYAKRMAAGAGGGMSVIPGQRRQADFSKKSEEEEQTEAATSGVRQWLPLKVNAAGVMPIIFAQAVMFIPSTLMQATGSTNSILSALTDPRGIWYALFTLVMVVVMTYLYTALIINPVQMSDELKKNGGYIPGVKPGQETSDFIDNVMSRITFPGALFLGLIAILPSLMMNFVDNQWAYFYGGTSLLITVGVILDTLQQIESHLLMKKYDGLSEYGRIQGRTDVK